MKFFSELSRALGISRPEPVPLRPPRPLNRLKLHVTHACNLTCDSCCHYSNHGHRGNLDLTLADRWMGAWRHRVAVEEFNLLGGEPTIHPRLPEFVTLVRRHWPAAHIRIITNGFFLHRHPDLPATLATAGNAEIALSVHHNEAGYLERLRPVFERLEAWQRDHGTTVDIWQSHQGWTRRYQGFGAAMLPFEVGQPRQSWEICPARHCKQLHEGKIWKCAPLAYLGLQKAKYDLSEKWDSYLQYQPLDVACTDGELDEFLGLEDESACSMCSAERRRYVLPNPLPSEARVRGPANSSAILRGDYDIILVHDGRGDGSWRECPPAQAGLNEAMQDSQPNWQGDVTFELQGNRRRTAGSPADGNPHLFRPSDVAEFGRLAIPSVKSDSRSTTPN